MLRLTLAQMRRSLGRLTAAAVAIVLGTAFVAATLIAGDVMTRTAYDAVTATYGDADLVVRQDSSLTQEQVEAMRAADGVVAVDPMVVGWVQLALGGRSTTERLLVVPSDPRLASLEVSEGAVPAGPDEVALPVATLERLDAALGDTVRVDWTEWSDDEPEAQVAQVRVVGVVDDPAQAWARYGGAGLAPEASVLTWSGWSELEGAYATEAVVAAAPGAVETARAALVAAAAPDAQVVTRDEAAAASVESLADGTNVMVSVVLAFASIALLVAALVISNTFQVLVAQRTRTLALLRCVGARRAQLRASVLLEAGLLGLAASGLGVLVGIGLTAGALAVLARVDVGVPLPTTVSVTAVAVLVPLAVGTLVTVLAALVPARAATRVAPVAALRPSDAPAVGARSGRVRLVLSLLLSVGGAAGMLAAVALARLGAVDEMATLGLGILGGAASFVGVVLGAVFWVPKVVAGIGRLVQGSSPSARIAAANTVRNPRRTAATSTALLIGVTLVVMMSTGAASARSSLAQDLDQRYPVDVLLEGLDPESGRTDVIDPAVLRAVAAVDGVRDLVPVRQASVTAESTDGSTWDGVVFAIDPQDARRVVGNEPVLDALAADVVVLPDDAGVGGDVTVSGRDQSWELTGAGTTLRTAGAPTSVGWVGEAAMDRLAPDATETLAFVSLDAGANAGEVQQAVQDAVGDAAVSVVSPAAERAVYEQVINTMLAVVVGLLGVAVVIALVGVANTLSLSVIERRRESATLRAIGLSRRGLRWMLAVEGMLIAGVGALLGTALGLFYGWAGAATVFGTISDLTLAVPWLDLALVMVVALAAGLLASVLPGRSAARTPPVAALAVD
ncbi:ABC transporter permease [Cellulomonas sp. SLBN-39]|uniref:ABC transporter permease n=1 Tax=Cellulomonas sp. SLBN-39 TaxID=2768446 RepID=UPI001153F52A|nr:ABC transporter permease [Cellulomonas sp. SLBN-39]TQL03637.1 putative ABC transport system permease protein [Cellulomonas sp. SLBN-39]